MSTKEEILRVTPLRNPLLSAITIANIAISSVVGVVHYVLHHKFQVGVLLMAFAAFGRFMLEPPQQFTSVRNLIAEHGSFTLYWVILGVLSSVGLGSGLHTFVLYLGPHILRVASTAVTHQTTDFSAKIDHYFSWPHSWSNTTEVVHAFTPQYVGDAWTPIHSDAPRAEPTFMAILMKVAWPAFLWGAGTALGELPPYFVARAARRAGEALEELEEVQTIAASASGGEKKLSLIDRAKAGVTSAVERFGFIAVFLAASIPNPLFDLAGLTCGHIGVPFATFFSATFLGKAVVKVGLQTFAIVVAVKFGPALLRAFSGFAEGLNDGSFLKPYLHKAQAALISNLQNSCKSEKAPLHECIVCCDRSFDGYTKEIVQGCHTSCAAPAAEAGPQPWYKDAFGYFILAMILYFVYSMVTSLVQERLVHDATHKAGMEGELRGDAAQQGETAKAASSSPSPAADSAPVSSSSTGSKGKSPAPAVPASKPQGTGKDKAPAAVAPSGQAQSKGDGGKAQSQGHRAHITHVHGAQLISALVNADDLTASPPQTPVVAAGNSKATTTSAAAPAPAPAKKQASAPAPASTTSAPASTQAADAASRPALPSVAAAQATAVDKDGGAWEVASPRKKKQLR